MAKTEQLNLALPGAIIEYGQAIAAAHAGIRPRAGAADGAEKMGAVEARLFDMVRANQTARRLIGIRDRGQDESERRVRLRVFALLAFRALGQPCSQPVSEISDLAAACMDTKLPPGEAVLRARTVIGAMSVEDLVVARGEDGLINRARLPDRAMEWISARGLGFLTVAKLVGAVLPDEKVDAKRSDPKAFVADLLRRSPALTPKFLFDELARRGYVGQEAARRRMSLAAYRHVARLRRIYIDGVPPESLPRENIMVRGPTGCGKTMLASTLFGGILRIP